MKHVLIGLLAVGGLSICGLASGADYWPLVEGAIYHYEDEQGYEVDVTYSGGNLRMATFPGTTSQHGEVFAIGGDGDVLLSDLWTYTQGAIDPEFWHFEPPIRFLDLPLEVGKTWYTETTAYGSGTRSCIFIYRVESQESVTVPFGTYSVFVVSESDILGLRWGVYYLDREIGPVMFSGSFFGDSTMYRLVGMEGTVALECESWGSLKALYR